MKTSLYMYIDKAKVLTLKGKIWMGIMIAVSKSYVMMVLDQQTG